MPSPIVSAARVHTKTLPLGHFELLINEAFADSELIAQLTNMQALIADAAIISHGKDYVVRKKLRFNGAEQDVAIKVFTRQSRLKDWYDKKNLSKAVRSYRAAEQLTNAGFNTPLPIACLDYWNGNRLIESYYLCLFETAICFRDALFHIFNESKDSEELMELLHLVAPEIRCLHDAGFLHGDLGNQNILLPKTSSGQWGKPAFIDLNRYRYCPQGLSDQQRAKDLARPILPGNYVHFFLQIYAGHKELPRSLAIAHEKERARFTRHRNSRRWRHPIRTLKQRGKHSSSGYPANKDYWLWDEKTAQPMIALSKKEKNKERNIVDTVKTIGRVIAQLPAIWKEYKALKPQDFARNLSMKNRVGVALNPKQGYQITELQLLEELGNPPVFIRFYRHQSLSQWLTTIALIRELHSRGVEISIGLLQDRDAVLNPSLWREFLEIIIPEIADAVVQIEITHAFNRAKWGVWRLQEWSQLTEIAFSYKQRFPQLKLTGPACIDFEYAPVISALGEVNKMNNQPTFDALSHLLYVDRRGAPENFQGKFSTLEKIRLLRAIANTSKATANRVIISEVNWPIENTHVWSPIVCPYVTARWQSLPSGESEIAYAHYMLRYYAITLCSGHVDQVFWWQLSAKGYGLVDDQDHFRQRPAFRALHFFLSLLGDAQFERRILMDDTCEYWLEFSKNGERYLMVWSTTTTTKSMSTKSSHAWDYLGNPIATPTISQAPTYLQLT